MRIILTLRLMLLAVFVLPSLVPTGTMLQRNPATSLVEITICSGFNHRSAWLNVATGEYIGSPEPQSSTLQSKQLPAEDPHSQAQELCPFAVSAAAIPGADIMYTTRLVARASVDLRLSTAVTVALPHLPPARGPPTLS